MLAHSDYAEARPARDPLSFLLPQEESIYKNGKLTHKITVVPTGNLTVYCTVTNELGKDVKFIEVSSREYRSPLPAPTRFLFLSLPGMLTSTNRQPVVLLLFLGGSRPSTGSERLAAPRPLAESWQERG